jgi:hypothetical protein
MPDASFELAARKNWCTKEQAAVDACLERAAATTGTATAPPTAADAAADACTPLLLAMQKCLRARTLAERAVRGDNMGRS